MLSISEYVFKKWLLLAFIEKFTQKIAQAAP